MKNDDYIIIGNGRVININNILNPMLTENISIKIKNTYSGEVLVDKQGRLYREKKGRGIYLFHIDDYDFDSVLWNNVGSRLEIEILNIGKDKL